MIKITSACGGDVIKFAGDALIVLWTDAPMSVLAHRACECAMELQDALHDSAMTQTIRLSLKVSAIISHQCPAKLRTMTARLSALTSHNTPNPCHHSDWRRAGGCDDVLRRWARRSM